MNVPKKAGKKGHGVSRRDFLKFSGAVAAGVQVGAVAGAGLSAGRRAMMPPPDAGEERPSGRGDVVQDTGSNRPSEVSAGPVIIHHRAPTGGRPYILIIQYDDTMKMIRHYRMFVGINSRIISGYLTPYFIYNFPSII